MIKYVNKLTNEVLTENEYLEMIKREYAEQWNEEYPSDLVYEFKEDGKTLEDYIEYQLKNNIDLDYEIMDI